MKRKDSVYEPPKHPELVDVINMALQKLRLEIRVAVPAKVVTYDVATQMASVQVEFLPILAENEQPLFPIIAPHVPVVFPRSGSGYITFPIAPGDTGQLIVNDRCLAQWLESGNTSDPGFPRMHNLADGAFYPGMHSKINPITPPPKQNSTVLEGSTRIDLGRLAANGVGRLGDEVDAGPTMASWITAATTKLNTLPGPPVPIVVDFGIISTASTKVFSE